MCNVCKCMFEYPPTQLNNHKKIIQLPRFQPKMRFQADQNIIINTSFLGLLYFITFMITFFAVREYISDPPYVYTGQVQLGLPDYTLLKIYLENSWRPVCASSLTQLAAQTACRQLGYTKVTSSYPLHFPG